MREKLVLLFSCLLSLSLVSCSTFFKPIPSSKAETGFHSQVIDNLMALPPPKDKMVIAVYKFRDQTGQYKQSASNAITYSTAVTQGATSMLMEALEEAGQGKWFTVVERESLPNLLNERKIIRQTRMQYMTKEELDRIPALPAMLYAPVIFDGGVVAYENNLLTGGLGAKYLGIGGDTQFQRDTVTVALRAIAVKDGRILKSVQTSKTIFSVKLDSSLYRFVGWQNLLELEAGFSSNEPPQMAVLEAIEQAVYSMIMEGAIDGIWSFQSPALGQQLIKKYLEEKQVKAVPIYNGLGEIEGFEKAPGKPVIVPPIPTPAPASEPPPAQSAAPESAPAPAAAPGVIPTPAAPVAAPAPVRAPVSTPAQAPMTAPAPMAVHAPAPVSASVPGQESAQIQAPAAAPGSVLEPAAPKRAYHRRHYRRARVPVTETAPATPPAAMPASVPQNAPLAAPQQTNKPQ